MFERFTMEARLAVTEAVEAAQELRAAQVDTGHLLVALARDGGPAGSALAAAGVTAHRLLADLNRPAAGLDPAALSAIGIDYDEVRRAVDSEFGHGALERALDRGRSGWFRRGRGSRFAPEAKAALERSLREALALRDRHIGSEHVLLGVLADPGFRAVRLLDSLGVDVAALRRAAAGGRDRRAG